jgi:flagellar basal body-associated protein FliL
MSLDAKDVELLKSIFGESKAEAREVRNGKNTTLIVSMIIAAMAPFLAAVVTYMQVSAAKVTSEETRKIAAESAETLKTVEHLVNSSASAASAEIRALKETILQMSVTKAVDDEREREGTSKAKPKPTP